MTLTLTAPPQISRDGRASRLAELVVHLTGCAPEGALNAVHRQELAPAATPDAALGVVARAVVSVSRPAEPSLRVTDYVADVGVGQRRATSRHDLQCGSCRRTLRLERWAPN